MSNMELEQGTDEWRLARCGKATSSSIYKVIAKTKSGWGAERKNYRAQLVRERVTQRPLRGYVSKAMEQGILREPDARACYAMRNNIEVIQVGFVDHPTIPMSGCSPDGYVGVNGGLEIKCPEDAAHLDFLQTDKIDTDYLKQIAWMFACHPERKWWDYVSYNPDWENTPGFKDLSYRSKRIHRAGLADLIAELEKEVPIFLKEVDDEVAEMHAKYGLQEAA